MFDIHSVAGDLFQEARRLKRVKEEMEATNRLHIADLTADKYEECIDKLRELAADGDPDSHDALRYLGLH